MKTRYLRKKLKGSVYFIDDFLLGSLTLVEADKPRLQTYHQYFRNQEYLKTQAEYHDMRSHS